MENRTNHHQSTIIEVRKKHLKIVLSKQEEFLKYQESLYKMGPEERAWRALLRKDDGIDNGAEAPENSDNDSD